ncbi:antitoxin [Lentilactobacillus raoultii]|uniref:Antitoxin n=1 Tax=Lentilactobacillus raoultii TaxID=1987503 RepID=A0ABW3PIA0_9LACO|nr:antitoxin [Lentilactobacillus raoultii]
MEKATNQQQFSVVINDRVAERLAQFCTTVGVSENAAVGLVINYFFDDPKLISRLMKGYREMATLNREISHDFSCCEEDADAHLAQYRRRLRNFY